MPTRNRSKTSSQEPDFPSRPAAEGTSISVVVDGEEQTIKATKAGDGHQLTPKNAAQAAALSKFSDAALNPPPPEPEAAAGSDDAGDGDGGDQA